MGLILSNLLYSDVPFFVPVIVSEYNYKIEKTTLNLQIIDNKQKKK